MRKRCRVNESPASLFLSKLRIRIKVLDERAILFHFVIVHQSSILRKPCDTTVSIDFVNLNVNGPFWEYSAITIFVLMTPIEIKDGFSVFIDLALRS